MILQLYAQSILEGLDLLLVCVYMMSIVLCEVVEILVVLVDIVGPLL
jgi:hypothetical protein